MAAQKLPSLPAALRGPARPGLASQVKIGYLPVLDGRDSRVSDSDVGDRAHPLTGVVGYLHDGLRAAFLAVALKGPASMRGHKEGSGCPRKRFHSWWLALKGPARPGPGRRAMRGYFTASEGM